jgi:tRNA pseudouridine38-40 synthase
LLRVNDPAPVTERTIRLTLHYDGSGFAGWQVQPGQRTVQGELEAALARLTTRAGRVIAAGRTDAGVHATGQVVGTEVPAKWQPDALAKALNAVLPRDIWVAGAEEAREGFHARYDAVARGYTYRLGTEEAAASPFLRRWCWPLGQALRLEDLAEAASEFLGQHSFRAFAKAGQPERGEVCTVQRSEWRAWHGVGWEYRVVANRFLHHMVRYMVGTMVEAARRRRPVSDIRRLLGSVPGLETSAPAPPEGLYLSRVYYHEHELERETFDETVP